jgi:hypothetical protein
MVNISCVEENPYADIQVRGMGNTFVGNENDSVVHPLLKEINHTRDLGAMFLRVLLYMTACEQYLEMNI